MSGLLMFIFHGYILKRLMIRRIRSRQDRLFEPDSSCILVGIEDVFSYDKMKAAPDDFGLLKITSDSVMVEMTEYRARFSPGDLCVSILHTGKTAAGVRVICDAGNETWSVVMTALCLPKKILIGTNSAARAKRLFELFMENGTLPMGRPVLEEKAALPANPQQQETAEAQKILSPVNEHQDVLEDRYQKVLGEIQKQQKKRKSLISNLTILVITLFIFFQLGIFYWGVKEVLMLLGVLFIHEAGHFIGMKAFGYKNIQMFFIPLMGAAVSGSGRNVESWKKAIVTLLGPLPGIFISFFLFIIFLISSQKIFYEAGAMFLILNLLNLLPIVPLDGGRFLSEVLFSRNRYIELAANILAAGAFLIAGFALNSWVMKILGFLNVITVRYSFILATATKRMRQDIQEEGQSGTDSICERPNEEDIPESFLKKMISWIYMNMPGPMKTKTVATTSLQIWERIRIQPPKWGVTIVLLVFFAGGYLFSFLSLGAMAFCANRVFAYTNKIVTYEDAGGSKHYKEQWHYFGRLSIETELTGDKQFYHGSQKEFNYDGKITQQGQWNMGRRTGQWKYFDPNGLMVGETVYQEGRPLLRKYLEEGKWVEYPWEELSEEEKKYYTKESQMQQGPDRVFEIDFEQFSEDANDKED